MNATAKLIEKDIRKRKESVPENGAVIRFNWLPECSLLSSDGYEYVGIYIANRWNLSGRISSLNTGTTPSVTHNQLMDFFANPNSYVRNIRIASEWEEV